MKLSENTVEFLKNFSTINQGLVIKPGKVIKTISSSNAILAEATIEEDFGLEFGIYDLNKTLGLLSMNKGAPEVVVEKDHLTFTGLAGMAKIRQRFTPPSLIHTPKKMLPDIEWDVSFSITPEIQNWILSVASILKCPNIVVKSDGGDINICAVDVKGEIVDDASVKVEGESKTKFFAVLKIENLKIINGGYDVTITSAGISRFSHKDKKIVYWIALEDKDSKFEK